MAFMLYTMYIKWRKKIPHCRNSSKV